MVNSAIIIIIIIIIIIVIVIIIIIIPFIYTQLKFIRYSRHKTA